MSKVVFITTWCDDGCARRCIKRVVVVVVAVVVVVVVVVVVERTVATNTPLASLPAVSR